ncbi:short subunit dehydrogenase [Rhodococcus sp. AG1013]|nr:short subunit dehydrogenase [Rhodococcus sp. AG1013]
MSSSRCFPQALVSNSPVSGTTPDRSGSCRNQPPVAGLSRQCLTAATFVAQVSVLTVLANLLRAQGSGQIVVFSSVAGIRVRKANYVYGSAKAGLDGFASGLGDALHGSGVHLLLVRSGFVIGRMTEGMSPAPLPSTPGQIANAVVKGLRNNRIRIWVPALTRPAYFAAHMLPQAIWRRMPR